MKTKRRSTRFKKSIYPNGLTLLTEQTPGYRSLSIGVWVKTGTRHESPRQAGMSHFLEHMLFKGTTKRSPLDIVKEIDQVGGEFNAFTSREYTCFHLMLLGKDLSLAGDILKDILFNSVFDSAEVERERKVVLQEISMVDESPEELVHDMLFELGYGKHPLGRPILGTDASIRRIKRGDVVKFFKENYRPDQLVVSVVGDISAASVRAQLKSLGRTQWPGRPTKTKKHREVSKAKPKFREGKWWIVRPTEQVHVVWGVEGPPYQHKDRFAILLLNVFLGGGMSSALFQEIREKKGLAYTVYSSLSPFYDSGVFSVYTATGPAQVPLCIKLIEECVTKLSRECLSEADLQVVKDNLKGTVLLSADNVESRMQSIAKAEIFFGTYFPVEQICEWIDQVKPADVRRVARRIFSQGKRTMIFLGPRPSASVRRKIGPKILKK